jgi:hypothetical protein
MISQQLLDYIKQQTQQGVPPDAIKNALRSNGWAEADIVQAFGSAPTPQSIPSPIAPTQTLQPMGSTTSHAKLPVVAIIVVVLLLVAGLAYAAISLTAPASSPVVSSTNNTATTSLPVVSSTTENLATPTTTPVTTQLDCGSMASTNIYQNSASLNLQEKTTLACASQAFLNCSPAAFVLTGTDGGQSYKISGQNGSYCSITMKINSPLSTKTCKIPMSTISQLSQELQKANQTDRALLLMQSFFLGGGSVTNTQTGQKIALNCVSS